MKRLARVLARFFPRSWRERYGAEFDALLEDAALRPLDLVDILKGAFIMQISNGRLFAAFALAGLAIGLATYFAMPRVYMSTMLLRISDEPELNSIARDVLHSRFLGDVVLRHKLYGSDSSNLDDRVHQLKRNIIFTATRDRLHYTIAVRGVSEQKTAAVLNELTVTSHIGFPRESQAISR